MSDLDLEAFAHVVAHDLGAPLRGMSIHLKLLQRQVEKGDTDIGERVEMLQQRLRRMDEMLRRIRAFSKVAAIEGGGTARIRQILETSWADLETDGTLAIEGDAEHDLPPLVVAAVLGEIVGNAVQHHPDTPTVKATIGDRDVVIEDDGPGIEDVAAARAPFSPSAATIQDGGGAGLAFAGYALERIGGELTIESSSHGTRVTIRFPSA